MPNVPATASPHARPSISRRATALAVAALIGLSAIAATPTVATATDPATSAEMASMLLSSMNAYRAANGLAAYRGMAALDTLATQRIGRMMAANTLSHEAGGVNIGDALDALGIPWLGWGEIIGSTSYPWGPESAADLFARWKASSGHNAIMLSPDYDSVGVGVVRAPDGSTWASEIMIKSASQAAPGQPAPGPTAQDQTAPIARNGARRRSGTTISFRWSGTDPVVGAYTSGLASFDLQYRHDRGSWRTIRNDTTATSIRLTHRSHRHWYGFRVRAQDRQGNLSKWTSEVRIWVP